MGRDQTRVLICAVASLALILAGSLLMDWYDLTLDGITANGRLAIDLQHAHVCGPDHACVSRPLTLLAGMFPTLATVTLWSSLGFAVLVAFQAGARLLTGTAHDAFTRLGYMLSLMAISLAVATAYLFGPEPEAVSFAIVSQVGISLHRTWAPLTLIAGLAVGLVAIYIAVVRESSDLGAAYKPVTVAPEQIAERRRRATSMPVPLAPRDATGVMRTREPTGVHTREPTGVRTHEPTREPTGVRTREPTGLHPREPTGLRTREPSHEPTGVLRTREPTGLRTREPTGVHTREPTGGRTREPTGVLRARSGTDPGMTITQPGIGPLSSGTRSKSGPLPAMPEHLRNRLQYVALTAELTAGGIDARREDGVARLVLWRDVVGVVARRMPPEYDGAAFVDIVSTAGSTLRIVPWTRLTGEPVEGDPEARPRTLIEHVVAHCPGAKIDPATRQFLDAGEPAQLPDLDTLRAHDQRLA